MGKNSFSSSRVSRRRFVLGSVATGAALLLRGPLNPVFAQDLSTATEDQLLDTIIAPESGELAIDALIEVFARSGIAVFDDALTAPLLPPVAPLSPLSLQRSQLPGLISELVNGSANPAASYDAMFPNQTESSEPAPSVGELLAGYYGSNATAGARFTKSFLDRLITDDLIIDPGDLPAPSIVMGLLGGEILGQFQQALGYTTGSRDHQKLAMSRSGRTDFANMAQGLSFLPGLPDIPSIIDTATAPLPPVQGETICGMAQSFVSIVLDRIFAVLKAAEAVREIPLIGGILGALIDGVKIGLNFIVKTFEQLLAPVMSIIKAISAGLAVASMLIGTFSPWSVKLAMRPPRNRFGIDAEVVTGEIDIQAGGWDQINYSPLIKECSGLIGLELPKPTSSGSPVILSVQQSKPLITLHTVNFTLDEAGLATGGYTTSNESSAMAKGNEVVGIAWVKAVVERADLKKLRDDLFNLLFSQLPDLIAQVIRPMIGPKMDQLTNYLIDLLNVSGTQPLFITYHEPKEEENPPALSNGSTTDCFPGKYLLVDPFAIQRMFITMPMEMSGANIWDFRSDGTVEITYNSVVLIMYPDPSAQFTFTFEGNQIGTYTTVNGVLSVTIVENNAVMTSDMIALQTTAMGPTPQDVDLTGPYTCGNPISWQVTIPEIGTVTYQFAPV